ncbi:hypothetical protein F5883DRAFT_561753 [Diaporthe sp. PMI_573]|nr:hypothetical protein F5883DRAFT_561753 [Diaporthaceae sp. PMI_573]
MGWMGRCLQMALVLVAGKGVNREADVWFPGWLAGWGVRVCLGDRHGPREEPLSVWYWSRLMKMPDARWRLPAAAPKPRSLSPEPAPKPGKAYLDCLGARPWPVPGIPSGIDGAGSAGETLVEVAGVWELSWSGVLGARRRRQPWDVWTP